MKAKKYISILLALVVLVAFSATAFATTEYYVGNGDYNCGSCPYNGGSYTVIVYGIASHDDVTTYITSTSYCGYNGLSSFKAHAGNFGAATIDRVRIHSFEYNNELRIDPNATSNWVGTNYNTTARYVYCVQRALYYLGYLNASNIDGIWGSITKSAVKAFQTKNGLSADGVVGTNTWATLCTPYCS